MPERDQDIPVPTANSGTLNGDQKLKSPPAMPERWDVSRLLLSLVFVFIFQSLYLPCLCAQGEAKIAIALWFDLLFAIRIAIAWILKERGRGWIFYLLLLYSSPFWIEQVVKFIFKMYAH